MIGHSQRVLWVYEMIYYNLSNRTEIHLDKMMRSIQQLLSSQQSLENKVLVIKIQNIISDNNEMIPKLEHKNLE